MNSPILSKNIKLIKSSRHIHKRPFSFPIPLYDNDNELHRKLAKKSQKYHSVVKVGDTFNYKLDGDEKEYRGIISKIYPYADTKTRKIGAEVLTNSMLVGLFGDGYITSK